MGVALIRGAPDCADAAHAPWRVRSRCGWRAQAITFDDWAEPMYALRSSSSPYVWVYFVLIVLLGGFFIVNLFLAVIFLEFSATKDHIDTLPPDGQPNDSPNEIAAATAATMGWSTAPAPFTPPPVPPASCGGRLTEPPEASRWGFRSVESIDRSNGHEAEEQRELLTPTAVRSDSVGGGGGNRGGADGGCWEGDGSGGGTLTRLANSEALSATSTAFVLFNMVLMCMSYDGMSDEYALGLERAASLVTWLFIGEMGLKLAGLGCHGYWSDGWNQLDGTIVILSIAEMLLTAVFAHSGVKLSFLRILRMLRVVRILRLMRSWQGLYKIIITFVRAMPQMGNLLILLLLTIFMFSLIGMQVPRTHPPPTLLRATRAGAHRRRFGQPISSASPARERAVSRAASDVLVTFAHHRR